MPAFYVSQRARTDGIHVVHRSGCTSIPDPIRRLYLGDFDSADEAVIEGRRHYAQVEGCELCAETGSAARSGIEKPMSLR